MQQMTLDTVQLNRNVGSNDLPGGRKVQFHTSGERNLFEIVALHSSARCNTVLAAYMIYNNIYFAQAEIRKRASSIRQPNSLNSSQPLPNYFMCHV